MLAAQRNSSAPGPFRELRPLRLHSREPMPWCIEDQAERHYRLGMVDQVREGAAQANERAYRDLKLLRFRYGPVNSKKEAETVVGN
jgi:hypothetical protein